MRVEELTERGVPGFAVDRWLETGIEELNPPQQQAVEKGVLDGESQVVASPTASGKTLIAAMAMARQVAETEKKALYLVPLKALGSEKYQDFTEFFEGQADVALSVGDRDSSDGWVETKDIIVMTTEKLDAVLRHNPSWISRVGLVVVDEIHLLNAEGRGPTLEVALTRLKELIDFQLLGLSATINNAAALADWLDATLVSSDYRPVELREGIFHDNTIQFYEGSLDEDESASEMNSADEEGVGFVTGTEKRAQEEAAAARESASMPVTDRHGRPTMNILQDTLDKGHQAITFVRSRKSAESAAERSGKVVSDGLARAEEQELEALAEKVRTVIGSPTTQCRRLADCVKDGAAFHHAGLLSKQRSLIEDAFRDGLVKSVSATPTLAAGVSLPAYRIIIRDVKRYTDNGLSFIPTLEYKQMAGRAGRPEHHDHGEAIAVAKQPGMVEDIRDRYVLGTPEKIYSKLAVEPVLRMHTLGLIATRFATSFEDVVAFFDKTFYAHQYGNDEEVRNKLESVVDNLVDYGFVEGDGDDLEPTKVGRRVAELYIDPYTAHHLMEGMERARNRSVQDIAYLHLICDTVEMKPRLRVRSSEQADVEEMVTEVEDALLFEPPQPWDDLDYDRFLKSLKTGMMLKEWIEEKEEDDLMDRYNVTPGGIRAKVENADWLLYACTEICTLQEWDDVRNDMQKLRTRVKHGIGEELLPLVRFKGIGRVRARRLHERGIETAGDIRDIEFTRLKKLVGKRTAEKLKKEVGDDNMFDRENILDYFD